MDFDPLPPPKTRGARALKIILALGLILALGASFGYMRVFGAPEWSAKTEQFIVPLGTSTHTSVGNLKAKGFAKSAWALEFALEAHGKLSIAPGGYQISKSMNVWDLSGALAAPPPMIWVKIIPGLRKEEIADILAKDVGWTSAEKAVWMNVDTASDADHVEGVYLPETYLMPRDASTAEAAKRLLTQFNDIFAPYLAKAGQQNVKWTTALKVASLVQREAGKDDMPLISGILWNRLAINMPLGIDATLQYAKGTEADWWPALHAGDTALDSP